MPKKNDSQRHGNKGRYRGKPRRTRITPGADRSLKNIFKTIGVPEPEPFTPDPFQLEALAATEEGDCLVTAPTGAGKTWIAERVIERFRGKGGSVWYASPLKALTNAKYIEFSEEFGTGNVGILTGDRKENPDAPIIVGTTEILRNQLYDAMYQGRDLSTDFVILDEAHFLGDRDRGVVWEEIMIYLPVRIPMLMLSATIGNADQIAEWLSSIRMRRCIVVKASKRPVPLFPLFFHPSGTLYPLLGRGKNARGKSRIHKDVNDYIHSRHPPRISPPGRLPPFGKILQVFRKYRLLPAIFFLKSRADCDKAIELCRENQIHDPERRREIRDVIDAFIDQIPHIGTHRQLWHLEHLGVGAHHSGQLPSWKLLVEALMTAGLLDAVFATSTVAAGVNFPARTVVFLDSDKFNGIEFLPLSPTEFHQMTGRAGRRGMDKIGFAAVLPGKFMDVPAVAKLVTAPPGDVLSQIRINFSMTLNLLLSHTPHQIQELLKRSFATYLIHQKKKQKKAADIPYDSGYLWRDFQKHFHFLIETGYVSEGGQLTEDGIWASQLRVDQPLMIAEGFKHGVFPDSDPVLLAAIIASFVNERETDERIEKEVVPNKLKRTFLNVVKKLSPFKNLMESRQFETTPLYMRPALTIYLWAAGGQPWERVLSISDSSEGDLAMLILRTADNLRHIVALKDVFPEAAKTASDAIERIVREPVVTFYAP